jgi:hypothetical protein
MLEEGKAIDDRDSDESSTIVAKNKRDTKASNKIKIKLPVDACVSEEE